MHNIRLGVGITIDWQAVLMVVHIFCSLSTFFISTSARLELVVCLDLAPKNLDTNFSCIIYIESGNQVAALETFTLNNKAKTPSLRSVALRLRLRRLALEPG